MEPFRPLWANSNAITKKTVSLMGANPNFHFSRNTEKSLPRKDAVSMLILGGKDVLQVPRPSPYGAL